VAPGRRWSGERDQGEVAATAKPKKSPNDNLDAAVPAAQGGDEHAFGVLYQELQPILLRYLYALVGVDCEDVAAESWLRALLHWLIA